MEKRKLARIEAALDRVDAAAGLLRQRTHEALRLLGFGLPAQEELLYFLSTEGLCPRTVYECFVVDLEQADADWRREHPVEFLDANRIDAHWCAEQADGDDD